MSKDRFSPERNSAQTVLRLKEIYRKEEKVLGISPVPERLRFERFLRGLRPPFSSLRATQRDLPQSRVINPFHRRAASDFLNPSGFPDLNLENAYRKRILEATKSTSPFFVQPPISRATPDSAFYKHLNPKPIFKGMGYTKSNILIL